MRLPDPEHQAELDALMAAAWPPNKAAHDTAACAARMRDLLLDAEQADRAWARTILDRALMAGCQGIGKRWAKKHNRILLPVGSTIARRIGVKRRSATGGVEWQQSLIESATWDEIEEAINDLEKMIGTLVIDKEARARLLGLRDAYPTSRCPAEAARLAATTVAAVMSGEWAA